MKTVEELKDGECVVVARHDVTIKRFKGVYDETLKVVFFTIPYYYGVIGYEQD